jgi:phytoene dehydrogenase-like protein
MDANLAGPASFPAGGMGALTEALSKAACEAGVEVRTNHDVSRIVVKDGEACGVVLSDGTELAANIVVSNADPKHTLLHLVDPLHLDPSFVEKMRHYRCTGTVAKLNFALSDLPKFTGLSGRLDREALSGRIHIGPEIDYLERAFDHSKYGEISLEPYLDISIPTITDSSLAPAGKHVMSVHMQFAPFQLKEGNWGSRREELRDLVTKTISGYAPNFRELILGCQVITPEDLEQTYGFAGGHIFHGDLALDQLFTMRPLLGWARYRTPIRKLYLCGSGTHPGLGLNGASGVNAAREIVKDLR